MMNWMNKEITEALMHEINEKMGTHWSLGSLLAGGVMGGAWSIVSNGRRAVLKIHDPASSVPHNPDAPQVVAHIRKHGYPTPKWLAAGVTKSGFPYSIQAFAPGKRLTHLTMDIARIMIDLVELQRTLHLPTTLNWNQYMYEHVFQKHKTHKQLVGVPKQVLYEALELTAPYRDTKLTNDEMVHSDLSVSNILVDKGKVTAVVDIDAAGRGCAVYDVLSGALNGVIWNADPKAIDLLHQYSIKTYGPGAVAITAGTLVIEGLAWRLERSPEMVEKAAQKSLVWLDQIRALSN